jgi:hypothetical protein
MLQRASAGSCEHGNEPLDSIKGREFLLSNYKLLKKHSAISWITASFTCLDISNL